MKTCGRAYGQNAVYYHSVAMLAVCRTYIFIEKSGASLITTARSGKYVWPLLYVITLKRHNSQFYVQNGLIEKDLAYIGIREDVAKEGHFRPEPFVFKVGAPNPMDLEGYMASMGFPAHHSVDVFMNDDFLPGMTSIETKE